MKEYGVTKDIFKLPSEVAFFENEVADLLDEPLSDLNEEELSEFVLTYLGEFYGWGIASCNISLYGIQKRFFITI